MKRDNFTLPLGLDAELLIDNFAGGGGASEGIEQAFGRPVDVAINHDGEALAMHAANHPKTAHYEEDVFDIHPGFVTGQRPIGLAWFSPDCKHHSKAKGGKPREKKIRGLAWVTLKWGTFQMPRCIGLENVEEFMDWGPLDDAGKPVKAEKGRTFRAFIDALSTGLAKDHPDVPEIYEALGADFPMHRLYAGLGYKVEYRILRACDYGTPTIRKRLFVFARRDGLPIRWPAPTHGNPKLPGFKQSKLQPWRTAAECIDWSIHCPSIFKRKRPLKDATLRRIAKGIMKFVVNSSDPFIVKFSENSTGQHTDEPLHTVMAGAPRFGVVSPTLMHLTHHGADRTQSVDDPLPTVTGAHRGEQAMVAATLVKQNFGDTPCQDAATPLHTITTQGNKFGVVSAHITKFRKNSIGTGIDEPIHTICAGGEQARPGTPGAMGIVQATLAPLLVDAAHADVSPTGVKRWGDGHKDIQAPIGTVAASGNHALVTAFLAQHNKERAGVKAGRPADEPVSTVTASGGQQTIVMAHLEALYSQKGNEARASCADDPMKTVTATHRHAVVASSLVKLRGTCQHGQPVDEPMATISAQGTHIGEVRAFLIKYYSEGGQWQEPREPMHTIPTKDRIGLVTIHGEDYAIVDIGMRMLTPRELARAQGFPDTYILDPVVNGKPLSKTAQVRMIGNSVAPPVARALIKANFTHEREIRRTA